jgi:formylglycine-generating enzyme required for sulfatase activity
MPITQLFAPPALKQETYTVGKATFRMVSLPGKEGFWMGSEEDDKEAWEREKPRHQRNISAFSLAEIPVTQELWQEVVARARVQGVLEEQALPLRPAYFQGTHRPVETVNWNDAVKFCQVLNRILGKPKGYFRLPSEAEWESAARAGIQDKVHAGSNQVGEVAWFGQNCKKETMPIGLLAPNDFGLYDLSGNIDEWCEDDSRIHYKGHPPDGRAWIDDPNKRTGSRSQRGGSWTVNARGCRLATRNWLHLYLRFSRFGFRLAAPG